MTKEKQTKGLLKGVAGMFHRGEAQAGTKPADQLDYGATAAALQELLSDLSEQAEERRRAEQQRQAVATGRVTALDKDATEEVRQTRREEAHARIRKDVLKMHERLETGIDDGELTKLDEHMRELCGTMAATAAAGVEPYIAAMVVRRFFDETGPLAWSRLLQLMDAAGVEWPASDDTQREQQQAEAQEMFLHSSPAVSGDLITGIVAVWQDHYPKPDSPLWQRVCLRACGAGLRARMLRCGVEYVREHAAELKAEGEALMRDQIATVQQALQSGLRSVEEADQVMAGAGGLLEQVLPDLCWTRAEEIVTADRPATPVAGVSP